MKWATSLNRHTNSFYFILSHLTFIKRGSLNAGMKEKRRYTHLLWISWVNSGNSGLDDGKDAKNQRFLHTLTCLWYFAFLFTIRLRERKWSVRKKTIKTKQHTNQFKEVRYDGCSKRVADWLCVIVVIFNFRSNSYTHTHETRSKPKPERPKNEPHRIWNWIEKSCVVA